MRAHVPVRAFLALALAVFAFGASRMERVPPAHAVSDDIVISQIYGGGGNAGAVLTHDFVELFNRGSSPVVVTGWSVQYASAARSFWQKTELAGTIQPGQYYLVVEAEGAEGSVSPPAPDAAGAIALSQSAGKIALVSNQIGLSCGTAANPCLPNTAIRDLVGYGSTASTFEGAGSAPAPSNTTSVMRAGGGCTDTDQNASDFTTATANPRHSGSTPQPCLPVASETRIHDIQGTGHLSPKAGEAVSNVPGIVTATRHNGFYMQDPLPDTDDRTSEGVFVFTASAPSVAEGDGVAVSGTVSEFRPSCPPATCTASSSAFANLTITEIVSVIVTPVSSGNPLPPPIAIGTGGRTPPTTFIDHDSGGSVEAGGPLDVTTDGIDFYESLEGMRVQVQSPIVVGPRSSRGDIPVLADLGAGASLRSPRGGIVLRDGDPNPERIILDRIGSTPQVSVGDALNGAVTGVVDYAFGNFKVVTSSLPPLIAGGLTRETASATAANQLAIATFNVENLHPGEDPAKFAALAETIVANLGAPDLIGLQEVQDNNGPINDAEVDASATFGMLIDAIVAAGGPSYEARDIPPVDGKDGGQPGGNIRVGFLFRTDRGLSFVDRPGGGPTTSVKVQNGPDGPELSSSPGRIKPTDGAFAQSRKPLVGEFRYNDRPLIVIALHLVSRLGDEPLFGRFQPPKLDSTLRRTDQAQIVHDFVATLLDFDPTARVIVLGDLNDYQFAPALATLAGGELHNLTNSLPAEERYSYIFEGNGQTFDHILVSQQMLDDLVEHDIVHVNSEFADQASDHDPARALFLIPPL